MKMIQYLPKKLQYALGYAVSVLTSNAVIETLSFVMNALLIVGILIWVL